jgi:hypothetical protein
VNAPVRWAVVVVDLLLILALVIWARGDAHHRGDDVGSRAQTSGASHV